MFSGCVENDLFLYYLLERLFRFGFGYMAGFYFVLGFDMIMNIYTFSLSAYSVFGFQVPFMCHASSSSELCILYFINVK